MSVPKCQGCQHLVAYYSTHGGVRNLCYCEHPRMAKFFGEYGGRNREPGFVAFSIAWSKNPDIKTSPRWCPLRHIGNEEEAETT